MEKRQRKHFLGINWGVRLKNPQVVMALTAALILLVEQILSLFGLQIEAAIGQQVTQIIQTVLAALALLGVVQDPTNEGFGDTKRVMGYRTPQDSKILEAKEKRGGRNL